MYVCIESHLTASALECYRHFEVVVRASNERFPQSLQTCLQFAK